MTSSWTQKRWNEQACNIQQRWISDFLCFSDWNHYSGHCTLYFMTIVQHVYSNGGTTTKCNARCSSCKHGCPLSSFWSVGRSVGHTGTLYSQPKSETALLYFRAWWCGAILASLVYNTTRHKAILGATLLSWFSLIAKSSGASLFSPSCPLR